MKIDCDTCVLARPLIRGRFWLMLVGLSLSPATFGDGAAVAQLQLGPDAAAAVRLAKKASKVLPDRSVAQEKNPQKEQSTHSQLIKKALGDGSAQKTGSDSTAKESQQAPAQQRELMDQKVIDQINAIRRQMGGGVADQLDGLFDDSEQGREQLQQEFNRELNQLVAKPRPAEVPTPVPAQPRTDAGNRSSVALRNAARELDAVAADLEDAELYQAADGIRASAANLRSQARTMAFSRTAKAKQSGRAVPGWRLSPVSPDESIQSPSTRSGLPASALDPKIRPRQ
jgi:hypothetical protein